jgi:type IX secretion system PorP/SprF family membrane protein
MKVLNKITIIIAVLFFQETAMAQQDPMYSMYMFDRLLINPAYAGSSSWIVSTVKHRNQYTGFKGHPRTQTFNIHTPIQKKHLGVGFKVVNDKIAVLSNLNLAMQLSYHLNFAGGKLSAGFEAGIYSRKTNYNALVLDDLNDVALNAQTASSTVPDLSVGMYYQKKQFYCGLSNYHLIKTRFDKQSSSGAHLYNHIYITAGNVFQISNRVTFEPSLLLKYQPSSTTQVDLNALVYYKDKVGAGLQYRSGDALVAMIRLNLTESIRFSYSYDHTTSKFAPYSGGSHELMISYGIKLPPPPTQKEIHPRYYF